MFLMHNEFRLMSCKCSHSVYRRSKFQGEDEEELSGTLKRALNTNGKKKCVQRTEDCSSKRSRTNEKWEEKKAQTFVPPLRCVVKSMRALTGIPDSCILLLLMPRKLTTLHDFISLVIRTMSPKSVCVCVCVCRKCNAMWCDVLAYKI